MKRKSVIALLAITTALAFNGCGSTPTTSTNGNSQDKENEVMENENPTQDSEVATNENETNISSEVADAGDNTSGGTESVVKDESYYINEYGVFDYGLEEAGLTREEDAEDGWLGFTVHWGEDGWSYVTYNKDGTRYEIGDTLPNDFVYTGANEEEQNAYLQKLAEEWGDD